MLIMAGVCVEAREGRATESNVELEISHKVERHHHSLSTGIMRAGAWSQGSQSRAEYH